MSIPSMLAVPKRVTRLRVTIPSLHPMSRHFRFWNQGFSITCLAPICYYILSVGESKAFVHVTRTYYTAM